MARHALSSMLDELMGKHRNALPSEKPAEIGFEDPEVCKYFLVGYCHHELFNNTKADLGLCGKTHDDKLRDEYRASEKFEKLGYEDEWLVALQRVHSDMQRKIMRNKQRLALTQSGPKGEDGNQERAESKIDALSEKIIALLQQAETLGSQGRVEDAQKLIEKTEQLKAERDECRKALESPIAELKAMEVCDTCGCFLIIGDSSHRIEEHLTGKQHLGFAKVKATIDELIRRKEEKRCQREEEFRKQLQEREKQRRDADGRDRRHHSRHRSRSRSPGRGARSSRSHHFPKCVEEQRHHYRRDDSRRHYRPYEKYEPGRTYDRDRYHSSSRYPNYDGRRSSHHRSRSPQHRHSKSPRAENGRSRRSEDNSHRDIESDSNAISTDANEPDYSAASSSHKVNSSSPSRLVSSAPGDGHAGTNADDDDDEEGAINSSDE